LRDWAAAGTPAAAPAASAATTITSVRTPRIAQVYRSEFVVRGS
jgi:hypothetical protein